MIFKTFRANLDSISLILSRIAPVVHYLQSFEDCLVTNYGINPHIHWYITPIFLSFGILNVCLIYGIQSHWIDRVFKYLYLGKKVHTCVYAEEKLVRHQETIELLDVAGDSKVDA